MLLINHCISRLCQFLSNKESNFEAFAYRELKNDKSVIDCLYICQNKHFICGTKTEERCF